MVFYVIELQECIKVGVSDEIEKRFNCYEGVKRKKFLYDLDSELCSYLEATAMSHFDSATEYIYNSSFEEVLSFVISKKNTIISNFDFKPLGIDLIINSDGLYKLNNIIDYINIKRKEKGKREVLLSDYTKTKQSIEFIEYIKQKTNKIPLISKRGKYGGSYGTSEIVIDIIMWGDSTIKYNVLNWMYNNKQDYVNFVNPSILNIATKNAIEVQDEQ